MLIPQSGDDRFTRSKAVGKRVDAITCELEGIILGLELSLEYYKSGKYEQQQETLNILCDCSSAIDINVHKVASQTWIELFQKIIYLETVIGKEYGDIVWLDSRSCRSLIH